MYKYLGYKSTHIGLDLIIQNSRRIFRKTVVQENKTVLHYLFWFDLQCKKKMLFCGSQRIDHDIHD